MNGLKYLKPVCYGKFNSTLKPIGYVQKCIWVDKATENPRFQVTSTLAWILCHEIHISR